MMQPQQQIEYFDIEIVGTERVEVLVQFLNDQTGVIEPFWIGRMDAYACARFDAKLADTETLRVGFNSTKFDMPIIAIVRERMYSNKEIQEAAESLINVGTPHWQVLKAYDATPTDWNHIDLYEVAPGVQISLKTYAGRLAFPTMVEHTNFAKDLVTQADFDEVAAYCANDLRVTQALHRALKTECELRTDMSYRFEMDLRSKSDAQIAEAVISDKLHLKKGKQRPPRYVRYVAPALIQTSNLQVLEVVERFEAEYFTVNPENGAPIEPEWLKTPIQIGKHKYKFGLGGLHSVDDNNMFLCAGNGLRISDFDVGSYYPMIMMACGVIPNLGSRENGVRFMEIYKGFYVERMEHKRAKHKKLANSMKIFLNGTFGKLGSIYSPFYAPDLMLAVTITGQLNLAILIAELEELPEVVVRSANTDGIVVQYPDALREELLAVFEANSKRTTFEYEETMYAKYAARDVNNYISIQATSTGLSEQSPPRKGVLLNQPDGSVKRKGQYASSDPALNALYLQKNPGMDAATNLAVEFLLGKLESPREFLKSRPMREFVAIQNIRGGGVQHTHEEWVDDWMQFNPQEWVRAAHLGLDKPPAPTKRVSRPKPVKVYTGGECFGKVARWYMTTVTKPPITTLKGNKVPCTDGAQLLLTMPADMVHPPDLDYVWYENEARRILIDVGVGTLFFDNLIRNQINFA